MFRKSCFSSSLGALSIPLFIFGVLFSLNIGRTFCLGDIILSGLGINPFMRFHNTLIVSLVLFIAGFFLGLKFNKDKDTVLGRNLCLIFGVALAIILIFYMFGVDLLYPFYSFPES